MWEWLKEAGVKIGIVVAVITGTYTLIKYHRDLKDWVKVKWNNHMERRKRKREREKFIDDALANRQHVVCSQILQAEHNKQFGVIETQLNDMGAKLDVIEDEIKEIKEDNDRQDEEIHMSLTERQLIVEGLFALVDNAKRKGDNHHITTAHAKLQASIFDKAYKPQGVKNNEN